MKNKFLFALTALVFFSTPETGAQNKKPVANPMDLNYRFQFEKPAYREAADPVCEYFKGKYYLFASKSGGYWSSPDLVKWTYIPTKTIGTIEDYAPTILVMDNALYFMASGKQAKIYKNTNPDKDNWELIDTRFHFPKGTTDPAFFKDDDGRVYIYWGCSDKDPILGVEVDPEDGFKIVGEPAVLIEHHSELYGWETSGNNNDENKNGWNEGPCMIKHNGNYYLQYAAPGTQFRVYGDGIYKSDKPLGPFKYVESNPFSFKPGGFIGGAGHGHTFKDKYGNYWHVASMKISQRHMFERRLGLFPLTITSDGKFIQHSVWSDYPFAIPDKKTDFEKENGFMGWHILSFNKPVAASSFLSGSFPSNAVDEKVETSWSAETGKPGEWFQVDLKKKMEVRAIQVNFADRDFEVKAPHEPVIYQYVIESSDDGANWKKIADKSKNTRDAAHELIVLDKPVNAKYLRISNTKELPGKFSLYDFRVFGNGKGDLPAEVTGLKAIKNAQDTRRYSLTWNRQKAADGYIVRIYLESGEFVTSAMVLDNVYEAGFFNRNSSYLFSVDAFNENGTTKTTVKVAGM